MSKDTFTDEQVEMEIARLNKSEHVKLAKKEMQLKYKRRQYMYQLRWMEKRGKQLEAGGVTLSDLDGDFDTAEADE